MPPKPSPKTDRSTLAPSLAALGITTIFDDAPLKISEVLNVPVLFVTTVLVSLIDVIRPVAIVVVATPPAPITAVSSSTDSVTVSAATNIPITLVRIDDVVDDDGVVPVLVVCYCW